MNEWKKALERKEVPPPSKTKEDKKVRTSPNQILAIRRDNETS